MRRLRGIRLFNLDRFGARLDRSVDEEVRFHLETRVEQLVQSGMSREEARAEVLKKFGDPDRVAERCRRIDGRARRRKDAAERVSEALKDLRLAFRSLRRAPGYTAVSVASLTVGIGVNAALLTAVHAIWVAPVPGVTGPERIVDPVVVQGGGDEWAWAYPDFEAVLEAQTPFESLAAWAELHVTMGTDEGGQRLRAALATSGYFHVLGAPPSRGRGFLPAEDEGPGQHTVVVISHDLWQEAFGGRPDVVGQPVTLNRTPYTVVGVAPEGFRGARVTLSRIDLWMPLMQHPRAGGGASFLGDRERLWVQVLGRLRPGATRSEAQAALQTVFDRLSADHPESNRDRTVRAASFGRFPAQNRVLDMLGVASLWGLVAVLLLIICANLAGMTLARSASREHELGVRLALGSTRFRLVRHLMAEAVLLALSGGVLGVALAVVGMSRVSPVELGISAPDVTFEPSGWILAISFAVSLATALAFGLLPALRFSRSALVASLKDDTGGGGRRVGRIQRFAASAQAGAALWLLVVGALFLRSLNRTDPASLGFEPEGMLVADFSVGGLSSPLLDMAAEGYPTLEHGGAVLVDRLEEALASLPGVEAVAVADGIPLDRMGAFVRVARADQADEVGGQVVVEATTITEGYFAALGMSLVRGRGFQRTDDDASEPVAVITESLAERLWPGQDPLGRQLLWAAGTEDAAPRTVVGVVGHVASSRASAELPHVFLPLRQRYVPSVLLVLRAGGDASLLMSGLREAFRAVDPGLPTPRLVPAASFVARATQEQRATGRMGAGLGFVVLLLSAMGVYGVMALAATQRTREIGLRVALGATRGEVVRRVLADALRLALPGMLVGMLLAAGTAAALRSMLLGLSPLDPVSFLSVGALLLLVVVLAGLGPAVRASGVQPVQALRAG